MAFSLRSERLPIPGLITVEHTLTVPLDHAEPADGRTIDVFARELADPDGTERPFLVYFQGGPGFEADRVSGTPLELPWIRRALREFRVLLLDERGTGRSTPVGPLTLAGMTPADQTEYLTHFRADAIVRDAELLREALGADCWSVLGQSFGGFCVTAYLSLAPDSLTEALLTGGLPPLRTPISEVYGHTYRRIATRSERYFRRYPADRARLAAIRDRITQADGDGGGLILANGDRLSHHRLRQLGQFLGMSTGAESVHHLLELDVDSPAFRHDLADPLSFGRNPIYAVIHEACYADDQRTDWAARRALPAAYAEDPDLFTGEHVFPWMFSEYGALAPLAEAAEILAQHPWGPLYDPEVLAVNRVPAAAAIYHDDPYVEREYSERTAAAIRGLRPWVTNEYDHNGLRADGDRVLSRLLDLARGRA